MCVKASDWAYLICFQHFLLYISNTDYMKVIQQIWAYNMNCTTFKVKDFACLTNRACENTLLISVELCPEEHVGCCVEAFFVQLGHAIIMKIF